MLARSLRAFASTRLDRISPSEGVIDSMEVPVPHGSNSIMQIYGPYRVSTTQPNAAAQRSQPHKPADVSPNLNKGAVDQLDLSSAAGGVNRMAPSSAVAGGGEIRIDRVAEIRRQIADGSYETAEKMDAALDRLLDQYA